MFWVMQRHISFSGIQVEERTARFKQGSSYQPPHAFMIEGTSSLDVTGSPVLDQSGHLIGVVASVEQHPDVLAFDFRPTCYPILAELQQYSGKMFCHLLLLERLEEANIKRYSKLGGNTEEFKKTNSTRNAINKHLLDLQGRWGLMGKLLIKIQDPEGSMCFETK
jgi:hypothetical protein